MITARDDKATVRRLAAERLGKEDIAVKLFGRATPRTIAAVQAVLDAPVKKRGLGKMIPFPPYWLRVPVALALLAIITVLDVAVHLLDTAAAALTPEHHPSTRKEPQR